MKTKEIKPEEEMNFLERNLSNLKEFLFKKVYYTFEGKIEVTVKREGEHYSYDANYHKGDIQFPFEKASHIVELLQRKGEEELDKKKDIDSITTEFTQRVYMLKPYAYIKSIIDKLK